MKDNLKYIKYIELYLCITLLLYRIGIWDYKTEHRGIFIVLVVSYQLALLLGYICGCYIKIRPGRKIAIFEIRTIRTLFIINIFMVLLNAIRMSGMNHFGISDLITKIIRSFSDFSASYRAKFEVVSTNVFGGRIGTIVLILWAFIGYAVIPLGMFYYNRLKPLDKALFYTNIAVTCGGALVIGTNKRIIDLAILALIYFYISYINIPVNGDNYNRRGKKKRYVITSLILSVFVMILANKIVGSRGIGSYWNASFYKLGGLVCVNRNSILLKMFPPILHSFLAIVCSYFSQGYYALSLAIEDGLVHFGFGQTSLWIVDNFNLNDKTIQHAIECKYGWSSRNLWHSAYTWIANDVGLVGVVFVLFFIGIILALLIKEFKAKRSPIVFILLYYFTITIIFLPCNLQMFQDAYGFLGFWTAFMLWISSHLTYRGSRDA